MTQLLVSVRSEAETEAAVRGGAHLIDVKEPENGALGRAPWQVIAGVVRTVAGRCVVSAAMGELAGGLPTSSGNDPAFLTGVTLFKWGLANLGCRDWQTALCRAEDWATRNVPNSSVVSVAYADWQSAKAPPLTDVEASAGKRPGSVLLVDTQDKRPGRSLLSVLASPSISQLCQRCRSSGVRVALAGSLGPDEIRALQSAEPDWFAVRGAACRGGRNGPVDEHLVRRLVAMLSTSQRRDN